MTSSNDMELKNEDKDTDTKATKETPHDDGNKKKKKRQNIWGKRKKKKWNDDDSGDTDKPNNRVSKDESKRASTKSVPHEGSFANSSMQKLFNVTPRTTEMTEDKAKTTKKKVAMLISFLGTSYVGMQMNEKQKTIHAMIEYAIYQSGFLSLSNFGFPGKYSWSNSARTDKGVHALAQVISCKLEIPVGIALEDVKVQINQWLPRDIKVLDVIKVTKGFNAKTSREKVRYQYILPSYILLDPKELCDIFKECGIPLDRNKNKLNDDSDDDIEKYKSDTIFTKEEIQKLHSKLTSYRLPPSKLTQFQKTLQTYKGTHSFHNYTNRKKPSDASCQRYIISYDVIPTQTQISPHDNSEWIVTQVVGQSFLLHQIRKMISMAIDVTRGSVPIDIMTISFRKDKIIRLDLAPSQGLLLEMSYFDGYNQHKVINDQNRQNNSDEENEREIYNKSILKWHQEDENNPKELTDVQKEIKDFKENVIIDYIMKEEKEDGNFLKYIYLHECRFTYEGFEDVDVVRGIEK